MTLGDSERLPLPHTKGTKPAPSTVKVSVYLIQVKKYFVHEKIGQIMKLNVPVKGLEPPLPYEKWILNPSRLPIPPLRHLNGAYYAKVINLLPQEQANC